MEFGVELPPNARIKSIVFDDVARALRISLADGGAQRITPIEHIRALHGARLRRESVTLRPKARSAPLAMLGAATALGTGVPLGVGALFRRKETEATEESLHYVLALRVDGIGELWYLLADSFNFRYTLGRDAVYVTEFNVRKLVKRLAAFAPQAVQDAFFAAIIGGLALPPPLDSLLEFFRTVSR
jgi:hypothetical protein